MNFRDRGIIIAKNSFKENSCVVTLFTENHGLHSGLVRQYNRKNGDVLSPANLVDFFWNARLHEHLGNAKCELIKSFSSYLIKDKMKLYAFNSICALIKKAFCERETPNGFFPKFLHYLESLKTMIFSLKSYLELEIELLAQTGYQLVLNRCVVTNQVEDLCYVSPKSGQAVCRSIGQEHASKLLILPQFLVQNREPSGPETQQAFALTSYFLNRYILQGRSVPEREALITTC